MFVLVLFFSNLCPPSLAIILIGERAGCFTLTVLLVYCDSQCCVVLPIGAEVIKLFSFST